MKDQGHSRWAQNSGENPVAPIAPGKRALTDAMVQRSASPDAAAHSASAPSPVVAFVPGQSFLDSILAADTEPVQRRADTPPRDTDVHGLAAAGIGGASEPLPFLDVIQSSFGAHDVTGVQAHTDDHATTAAAGMGATAFATGDHVAFAGAPDLHTTAHEAAHVVQQRAGVQLKGGVGAVGDEYEQHADEVADAVVRGDSAEGLLGARGTSASTFAIQQKKNENRFDETVTPDEATEQSQKLLRIGGLRDLLEMLFDTMTEGVQEAVGHLEARTPKRTAFLLDLVNIAAGAAVAGVANVVATTISQKLFAGMRERFVTDAIKDVYKKSIHVGTLATDEEVELELRKTFGRAQIIKIERAKGLFIHEFSGAAGDALMALPVSVLDHLKDVALARVGREEIMAAAARSTSVEWANLVARSHHGAGGWDHWAGEHGSDFAVPTKEAAGAPPKAHEPKLDPLAYLSQEHASSGNVDHDSASMRDSIDTDQKQMNPDLHGILEVNVFATRPISLYTRTGFGMRMNGVSPYVKNRLEEFPSVGAINVNKSVTVYRDENINPPKPANRFLITADGYVRSSTTGDEDYLAEVAAAVQAMRPKDVQ